MITAVVVVGALSAAGPARADIELSNDTFTSGGTAAFSGGFVFGEAGASRFVAPAAGRQVLKVHLLFGGGSTAAQTVTLKVWDDSAGTDAPGTELFTGDFPLTGSDTAIQELDVSGASTVIVPQQFRVGIVFQHSGAPSIARDTMPPIMVDKNYIMGQGVGWAKAQTFGVNGNWIIRAVINNPAGAPDAGSGGPTPVPAPRARGTRAAPRASTAISRPTPARSTAAPTWIAERHVQQPRPVRGKSSGGCGIGESEGATLIALGVLAVLIALRRPGRWDDV